LNEKANRVIDSVEINKPYNGKRKMELRKQGN